MDNMQDALAIMEFIKLLDSKMKEYQERYGAIPLSYTYAYELLIYKVMELLGGDPKVVDLFREHSSAVVALLISMNQQEEQDPKIKDLNNEIAKAHDEKTKKATKAPMPESFDALMRMCERLGTAPNPEIPSKAGDAKIDAYLASKKKGKSSAKRGAKRRAKPNK